MKKIALCLISLAFVAQGCVSTDVISDPVSGMWAYYPEGGFVYLDNSGERSLTPEENRYFATSGSIDGVIFVARCSQHDDFSCIATDIAMMNKNGELLNRFGEFEYPQLDVSMSYPAAIVYVELDGSRTNFPLWSGRSDLNASGKVQSVFVEDRLVVEQNGMYGFIDRNGSPVVTPRFLAVKNFENSSATVISDQGVGSVDPYGHFTKEEYACIVPYDDASRRINVGGTLVNFKLDVRTQDNIYVSKSLALSVEQSNASEACTGGKWGLISNSGDVIIPPVFDEIIPQDDTNYLWVQDKEKNVVGYYDRNGNVIMPPEYPFVVLGDNFFVVQNAEGKFALFDTKGKQVTEFVFDNYQSLARPNNIGSYLLSEYVAMSKDGLWGVVSADGRVTVPFEYEQLGPESEGLVAFKRSKRWGVIDVNNKETHSPIYSKVGVFVDGRAEATLSGDDIFIYRDASAKAAWLEKARLEKERSDDADRQAAEESRLRNEELARERLEEQKRQTKMLAEAEVVRLKKEVDTIESKLQQLHHQHATTGSRAMEDDIRRLNAERDALIERINQLESMEF